MSACGHAERGPLRGCLVVGLKMVPGRHGPQALLSCYCSGGDSSGRDITAHRRGRNADLAAVRALLLKKADVNAAEGDGATALHWASYRDQLDIADLLIASGAKVNAANDLGATPLWLAAQNGSAAMTRRLLQAGADPNIAAPCGRNAADGRGAVGERGGR